MTQVDIIIPCYKYGNFLRRCVDSVLSQESIDVRVLIIDDASPDNTAEIAVQLVASDRRVHFLRHTTNMGHIATFNEGLAWASGEYTLLLSADDLLTPGSLHRSVRLLESHLKVGLVYGRALLFNSDEDLPKPSSTSLECGWKITPGHEFVESFCASGSNLLWTPTVLVRTRLQKALGGYRPELTHSGDMEMWMRFGAHSDIGFVDADQAYYRLHSTNMSLGYFGGTTQRRFLPAMADLKQRKAAFDAFFQTKSGVIKDAERLQQMAARGLAWVSFWGATLAFEQGEVPSCKAMLDFALELDHDLQLEPEWTRMRWKQRMGPKLWSAVRPVLQRVRPKLQRPSAQPVG